MMDKTSMKLRCGLEISERELRKVILSELMRMGFVSDLKGFEYFKELLFLVVKEGNVENLMEDKYKRVADLYGTNVNVLERNVRTLVFRTFKNTNEFKFLCTYFGVDMDGLPPTNGQLLSLLGEYIIFYLFEKTVGGLENMFVSDGENQGEQI